MYCDCLQRPVHLARVLERWDFTCKVSRNPQYRGTPPTCTRAADRRSKVPRIRTPLVASPVGRSAPDGKFSSGFRYGKSPVLVRISKMDCVVPPFLRCKLEIPSLPAGRYELLLNLRVRYSSYTLEDPYY